ncbi:MAG TPA: hypothetical protein VN258_02135 [Mobilitalea sp.]|nr:hypothetical protein [Mobilitalea sp.]
MKLNKICILIIAISISFCACKEMDSGNEAKEDTLINSDEKNEVNKEKEHLFNFMIGHGKIIHTKDISYEIEIIMKDGYYFDEDSMGPFYGDNYIGQFEIVLKKDGNIVNNFDLSKDWAERYDDELRFRKKFEIELIDYGSDGNYEFLIGQYFSSNLNLYKMYQINTSQDEIIAINDLGYLNVSGSRETEKLNQDKDGNYYVSGYDNSKSKYFKIPIIFHEGKITKGEIEYHDEIIDIP